MRKQWIMLGAVLTSSAAGTLACSGSSSNNSGAQNDAGGADSSVGSDAEGAETGAVDAPNDAPMDALADAQSALDGGVEAAADASVPARLLLSYNGSTTSELVAFGLASQAVDGRLIYPGTSATTYVTPDEPLAAGAGERPGRRGSIPSSPWVIDSSWNVA